MFSPALVWNLEVSPDEAYWRHWERSHPGVIELSSEVPSPKADGTVRPPVNIDPIAFKCQKKNGAWTWPFCELETVCTPGVLQP